MKRLFSAVLVLALVSGCSVYFQKNDEVAFSGQGVLASYDQSKGELTDSNRVDTALNKRRMKPVELAFNRITHKREEIDGLGDFTVEQLKRNARTSTGIQIRGK